MTTKTQNLIDEIIKKKVITEKEINLIKNRINSGKVKFNDLNFEGIYEREIELTPEQTKKGLYYLKNLYITPAGRERKNNPYGWREIDALETFKNFYFIGYYNAGNSYYDLYVPLYVVNGNKTDFEYYIGGGKINIIG
jgi:hypothetical protein